MTTSPTDECRKQFEVWAKKRSYSVHTSKFRSDEVYANTNTQEAWVVWRDSWKAALDTDIYEDVYEQCQELINPHIIHMPHGSAAGGNSLVASVVGSLGYLIEFWLKHREKVA